ncbi:DsbA family protein [Candidatus Woesearchaeota archaeon]|nr:DsbA family protein [Candidatus Woesearchaeota archaeon]
MEESTEGTVKIKKSTLWKGAAFVFGILFIVSIFTGGFRFGSKGIDGNAVVQPPAQVGDNAPSVVSSVGLDDDPVIGDKNAPVTIVEFSDFQCPFCGRFFSQTLPSIEENYINPGKVKFVYRDFPLNSIHPFAQKAAEASECADDQGKFKEMHDKIFSNQVSLSLDNLKIWAKDIGLDTNKFNDCLDSGKQASEVGNDEKDGLALGVQGTPAFFVGNENDGYLAISGAQPFEVFDQAIKKFL